MDPRNDGLGVTRDGTETRTKLLDAAARAFAEHGVSKASLLEITRQAGQRNRNAVHYHFGSRDGLLAAVLDRHVAFLARRESELLASALLAPSADLPPVIEAIVRPIVELAASGWRGRCYLLIVADLTSEFPEGLAPQVRATLAKTTGRAIYDVLQERLPPMTEELRAERLRLMTVFMLRATADRARLLGRRHRGRPQLADDLFIENLVAMSAGALTAAVPGH